MKLPTGSCATFVFLFLVKFVTHANLIILLVLSNSSFRFQTFDLGPLYLLERLCENMQNLRMQPFFSAVKQDGYAIKTYNTFSLEMVYLQK